MDRSVHLSAWDAGCSHELSWARGPSSLPSVLAGVGEGREESARHVGGSGEDTKGKPGSGVALDLPSTPRAPAAQGPRGCTHITALGEPVHVKSHNTPDCA